MVYRSFDKKAVCFILLVAFLIFSLITPVEAFAEFNIVDSETNLRYQLTQKDDTLHIENNNISTDLHVPDKIVNALCHDDILSLLCVTKTSTDTYFYTIREYDIYSRKLIAIATNITAASGQQDFYTNNNGVYYIPDNIDNNRLYVISENKTEVITAPSTVYQLLYTDSTDILAFTQKGTYLLSGNSFTHLSDLLPATPCSYLDDGIVKDAQNVKYKLSDMMFVELVENTSVISDKTNDTHQDTSVVIAGNTITIPYSTTFAKLYVYLGIEKSELKVYKTDGKLVISGNLGTGMSAEFSDKRYSLILFGDITGEGNINSRDLKALMKHLTEESPFEEPYLTAADIYNDNEINTKDLLALSRLY